MSKIKGVFLIIVDALRADTFEELFHLNVLKSLSKIKQDSTIFTDAYSLTNATDPSITTIMTGLHPLNHGLINHGPKITPIELKKVYNSISLSELLHNKGWLTIAIDFLERWHLRGFDTYLTKHISKRIVFDFLRASLSDGIYSQIINFMPVPYKKIYTIFHNATLLTDLALNYIRKAVKQNKNFFILLHYWSTHVPYFAPKQYFSKVPENITRNFSWLEDKSLDDILNSMEGGKYKSFLEKWFKRAQLKNVNDIIKAYIASIIYVDIQLEKIIDYLFEEGLLDNVLIIITGDHGESLGEHEIYFDHHGLYQPSLRVPLIIFTSKYSNFSNIFHERVIHTDIAPTILDFAEIKTSIKFDGLSLFRYEGFDSRTITALETFTEKKISVIYDDLKLIKAISKKDAICEYCNKIHGGSVELYNFKKDPKETLNIYGDSLYTTKKLERMLERPLLKFKLLSLRYNLL